MAGSKRRIGHPVEKGGKRRVGRPVEKRSKLAVWIEEHGWTRQQFAEELGIVHSSVDRLCGGLRRPSLKLALQIEALTEGAIPVSYWAEIPAHPKD